VIVGAIVRYGIPPQNPKRLRLVYEDPQYECNETALTVGEVLNLISLRDNFSCTVGGKVFQDSAGNFIQDTVSPYLSSCVYILSCYIIHACTVHVLVITC